MGARHEFVELGVHPKKELEGLETLESVPRTLPENTDDDDDLAPSRNAANDSRDKTLQR